jgi:hypothetical protein
MTNASGVQSSSSIRRNRFIISLLLAAAFTSALKDLSRLQDLTSWIHAGLASVYASNMPANSSCPRAPAPTGASSELVYKARQVAPDQPMETLAVLDAMLNNAPEIGGEIEMVAFRKARRSGPGEAPNRVTEQRKGVTIVTVYKGSQPAQPTTVPEQEGAIDRAMAARLANLEWPNALEFKALYRSVTLELPSPTSIKVDADTLNAEAPSDFPLSLLSRLSRRHASGNGGRELGLRTSNGIIRLRRAS